MLPAWWQARRSDAATMTAALAAPIAVVAAFAVAEVIKTAVGELRPCLSMPGSCTLGCEAGGLGSVQGMALSRNRW
ncbi:hypothetical protein AB0F71_35970 [Kitasatospora sp. NPDC028055]|uniref:hypothetical protein n=1 Tax=Kitasatospora sp. NPDC028055 TaxID=3155653 RepID=UPI0033E28852